LAAGREQVQGAHAQIEPWPQPGPLRRRRRAGAGKAGQVAGRHWPPPVERPAQRVDGPAEPGIIDEQGAAGRQARGPAARAEPIEAPKSQYLGLAAMDADDLPCHRGSGPPFQLELVADGKMLRQPNNLGGEAVETGDAAGEAKAALALQLNPRRGCAIIKRYMSQSLYHIVN
jgi:hypothetical protein